MREDKAVARGPLFRMTSRATLAVAAASIVACVSGGGRSDRIPASDGSVAQLIARAAAFELDTEYVPPPGEALHHQTAGFAKILCSGVFITGLDAEDAAANVGGFIAPFAERHHVVDTRIDYDRQRVALTLPEHLHAALSDRHRW